MTAYSTAADRRPPRWRREHGAQVMPRRDVVRNVADCLWPRLRHAINPQCLFFDGDRFNLYRYDGKAGKARMAANPDYLVAVYVTPDYQMLIDDITACFIECGTDGTRSDSLPWVRA